MGSGGSGRLRGSGSAPRACSSWSILRQASARARAAKTFGSTILGGRVLHDVPAGDSVQVRENAGQLDRRFRTAACPGSAPRSGPAGTGVCSRLTRNSGAATKQAVTMTCSKRAASHRESAGTRLGWPGRCRTWPAAPDNHRRAPGSSPPSVPCRYRCRHPGPGTAARPPPRPRARHLPRRLACRTAPPGAWAGRRIWPTCRQ